MAALLATLRATEKRLEEITGGEVDTVTDVDGRTIVLRRAQEQLRVSEVEKQAAILNALDAHVALLDSHGVILSVNDGWRNFGEANAYQGPGHRLGLNYLEICDRAVGERSAEARQVADGIRAVLEGRAKNFLMEYPCHAPAEQRWFLLRVTPLTVAGDLGVVVMHVNISERRRVELALQESETRFRATFEQAAVGIAHVAPDGRFLRVNDKLCGILGYGRAELLTLTFLDITIPDEVATGVRSRDAMLSGETPTYTVEKRYRRKNGDVVWVHLVSALQRTPAGEPQYFISVFKDITERKSAEDALDTLRSKTELRERMLTTALSSLSDFAYIYDKSGRFLFANAPLLKLWGRTLAEVIGKDFLELGYPQELARQLQREVQTVFATGKNITGETPFTGASGLEGFYEYIFSPAFAPDGTVDFVVGSTRDITERKRSEAAVRVSEIRYRTMFEGVEAGVVVHGLDSRITSFNAKAAELLGVPPSQMIGRLAFDASLRRMTADGALMSQSQVPFHRAATSRRSVQDVIMGVHRPALGNFVWLLVNANPVLTTAGEVVEVIVSFVDVTARVTAERALHESEGRYRALTEWSPEAIMVLREGRLLFVNPAAMTMLGAASAQQLIGQDILALTHPASRDTVQKQLESCPGPAGMPMTEQRFVKLNGTAIDVEIQGTSLVYDGKPGIFISMRDVTESKRLAEQLRQSQKMEAFGQLAGGVAHDFNNILTVIQGHAGLADSKGALPTYAKDSLRQISLAATRAAALTRQLLTFSHKQVLELRDLDVNEVVSNMTKMLRRILREDVSMELKHTPQPQIVHADAGMIEQILMNLTVNARDAMPEGGKLLIQVDRVELSANAGLPPMARAGSFVHLAVADTGTGIPPDILSRIFEPFFTTKPIGQGTGLGLATVYGIVQQHLGWIEVASEMGKGTTFHIFLPRRDEAVLAAVPEMPVIEPAGGAETILLVEDEPTVQFLVEAVLTQQGYKVLTAATGAQALQVWQQYGAEISLVITDLVMPDGMSGRELGRRLRVDDLGLRIIYISGYSAEIAGKDFPLRDGVNFLAKPFTGHKLLATVRASLDTRTISPFPPAGT